MDLTELRKQIDEIDAAMTELYRRRMETVCQIDAYKRAHDLPVYDSGREEQLLRQVSELAGPEYAKGTRAMFTLLLTQAKAYQRRQRDNIILIGMPGSGKTTVGKLIAERLGRPYISTDALVEQRADGLTCGEYILEYGEPAFRDLEAEAVREAARRTGCVIATGGGTVILRENMEALRKHGLVFHMVRPLEQLRISPDRPLSSTPEKLRRMWDTRAPLYAAWRDYAVEGEDAGVKADAVIALWKAHYDE